MVRTAGDADGVGAGAGAAEGHVALVERLPKTDIPVNNLGVCEAGPFANIPDEDWLNPF